MLTLLLLAALDDLPLSNPGFEDGGADVKGIKVAGQVGKGWSDNSDWADVKSATASIRSTRDAAPSGSASRRTGSCSSRGA